MRKYDLSNLLNLGFAFGFNINYLCDLSQVSLLDSVFILSRENYVHLLRLL